MNFVDIINISVKAGRGGNGCMSFRREKFVPKGGPDGGNGGRGGNIYLLATTDIHTLADFKYSRQFKTDNGEHGQGSRKNGAKAEDVIIKVPCGTIVYDVETGEPLADLVEPGDRCLIAKGGTGGKGNAHFASSRRRAPKFSEKGAEGEQRKIKLELKLIADVALVGVPNAGKSSLLGAISNATPKIADYPFTTLSPNLGVLRVDSEKIVVADIPGLIEGAHVNKGLGHYFLRHIERTRVIIHVLDLSSGVKENIIDQWQTVIDEFKAYNAELVERPYLVVGNKIDIPAGLEIASEIESYFRERNIKCLLTSAISGEGVQGFMDAIIKICREHPRPRGTTRLFATIDELREENISPAQKQKSKREKVQILKLPDGSYKVLHQRIEAAAARYDFSQDEAVVRFMRILRQYRVEELLESCGAVEGDSIYIGETVFEFQPEMSY